jgi:hypothetical protein
MIPADFALTDEERRSPVWRRLRNHMRERLERLREKNDGESQTEVSTAVLRGQIKCLKGLIALEDDPPRDG